jgi:hypothetical protein
MALKLKTRTQFPAVVSASSPVTVTKTGVSYTFGLDVTALLVSLDPYYAVTNLDSLILNGATSGTATVQAPAIAGSAVITLPGVTGTLATLAGTEELTNKTLNAAVAKGTWTVSGTWTIPAVTLGGTVSGGGNQINNVIIGTSTPLAGFFTTLSASSTTDSTTTATGAVINAGGAGIAKAIFGGTTLNIAGVATLASGTATPAGGSTAARLLLGTTAGFGIYYGSGAPTVSAAAGSLYIRTDNAGANLRLYSNTTGSTTWAAITSA